MRVVLVLSDIKNKWHKAKTCFLFENFGGSLHLTSFVLLLSILLPLLVASPSFPRGYILIYMKRSPTCPCLLRLKITIRHQLLCLCSLSHVFSFDTATSQQMNQSDRVQTANRGTEDECTHKITGPCYIIKQPTIQHS